MIEIIPNWHPVFVHFTVAMFSLATLFYVLSHLTGNSELQKQWLVVAKWNLWLGAVISIVTVAAGWQAYNSVDHDTPSHLAMTDHRNWAMATFVFFLLLAVWSVVLHKANVVKNWFFVTLLLIASGALTSTAWRGGEVVYRYGLGVMSLPKVEGEGHDHVHADGAGHGKSGEKSDEAMSATSEKSNKQSHGHDDIDGAPGHHDKQNKGHDEHGEPGHNDVKKMHNDSHGEPGHHDTKKVADDNSDRMADHHDDGPAHSH